MKSQWVDFATSLMHAPEEFYSGCRKIHRNVQWTVESDGAPVELSDCGYTKSKLRSLERLYLHEESRKSAVEQWENRRKKKGKYGSVGFHCFNHYIKGHAQDAYWNRINDRSGKVSRASVMGPCIQSVSLTLTPKGEVEADFFYRTTEVFKKFPADLIFLRETLMPPFGPIHRWNFHFANVTCHPMYFAVVLPLYDDPIQALETLKKKDRYFYDWTVKWTSRYLCKEHRRGIENFSQAMRVCMDVEKRLSDPRIATYLRKNHPGHRNAYVAPEEDADDDS